MDTKQKTPFKFDSTEQIRTLCERFASQIEPKVEAEDVPAVTTCPEQ